MNKTQRERQAAYLQRLRAKGLIRLMVTVPENQREQVLQYCAGLRADNDNQTKGE